jgi:hypothetical protein
MHPSKVFISYASDDVAAARRLFADLRAIGVEPWLDKECLLPGQRWEREIHTALRGSEFVVVLLSSRQVEKRGYVQREIRKALELLDEVPDNQVFLIPARLDDCRPQHDRLSDLHWVDLFPDWSTGLTLLREVFARVPERTAMPGAIDLAGTTWLALQAPGGQWRFECLPDGTLRYEDAMIGHYLENATWKQSGDAIYIQLNNSYVQLRGDLLNDRLAKGRGDSIGGWHFTWEARRLDAPHDWKPEPKQATRQT